MNDEQTDGGSGPLELRIDAKTLATANGPHVEIIRGLNLRLEYQSFGAIIGPSGCGKTTILRIAAGLDRDFSGSRRIPGRGKLGMVFQEPRLLPWRTVSENIRLALPADESFSALDDLIETLGLGGHLNHYPGELSLGLARRVAIARAFAVRPDVLLLDEPFVSLDDAVANRLREQLSILIDRGKMTTLLVTHDLGDAVQMADRVFFLSSGPARIIADVTLPAPRGRRSRDVIDHLTRELQAHRAG